MPLPTERVASRIESVWPHGGAADAAKANLTAQPLLPDTTAEPVPCRYSRETVQFWARRNDRREELIANGVRRMLDQHGLRYPV